MIRARTLPWSYSEPRQRSHERRPATWSALEPHVPTVRPEKAPRHRSAELQPCDALTGRCVRRPERVEHARVVLRGNLEPRVDDFELKARAHPLHAQSHARAGIRTDGVVEEPDDG